jgi:hypothetical protein
MPYLIIHLSQPPVSELSLSACCLAATVVLPEKQSGVAVPLRISIHWTTSPNIIRLRGTFKLDNTETQQKGPQSSNRHDRSSIGLLHLWLVQYREDDQVNFPFLLIAGGSNKPDAAHGGTTELHAAIAIVTMGGSSPRPAILLLLQGRSSEQSGNSRCSSLGTKRSTAARTSCANARHAAQHICAAN